MTPCRIILKPKEEIRIVRGHPWVYGNEIAKLEGDIRSGELAEVFSASGSFVGKGFLNTASKIFVRLLSRDPASVIDEEFFRQILLRADGFRKETGCGDSYRVLFGEADGIPGLIVDRYGDYLVVQILSLGIDRRKDMFVKLLVEQFRPAGILERSDVPLRKKEGLEEFSGILYGTVPDTVVLRENEIFLQVNLKEGQKTGTFLDQRENHAALKSYAEGKRVLDCFSHAGGFGLHAARYGAKSVECVDISSLAVNEIETNARLNGFSNVTALRADVFTLLRGYEKENRRFDLLILDPPAFAKTGEAVERAFAGYKEINLRAMRLLVSGGILFTCSCSQHMTPELFLEMLTEAAEDAGKIVQMVEFRIQGKDHPTLLGSDESLYLKCLVLRVQDKL